MTEASRPPMTFQQQAELLEYLHQRCTPDKDGRRASLTITLLDQAQVDDLLLTAHRLRRMAPHEAAIKKLVTGR